LKHSLQRLPSGSVLASGILKRTCAALPAERRALNAMPLYRETSTGDLGSLKTTPMPAKTSPPVAVEPRRRNVPPLPASATLLPLESA
jgi:hypothetical protein